MIDSANAISSNPVLAAIAANAGLIRARADLPLTSVAQFSDTVSISQAAIDLANALKSQNTDDIARQLANNVNATETGTAAAQNQVQESDQPSLDTAEQFLDTVTAEDILANDLQLQKDRDYAQLLADIANLTATETVATQNMEINSAAYSMASANRFRPRSVSQDNLQI